MKIRIAVTVDVPRESIPIAVELAKSLGHDFDGTTDPRTLLRRFFEDRVTSGVDRLGDYARGRRDFLEDDSETD